MLFEGKVTTDRNVIKRWIEQHQGWPALAKRITGTEVLKVLQIGFPDCEETDRLEAIPWEKFFEKFEKDQLAFMYREDEQAGAGRSFLFL